MNIPVSFLGADAIMDIVIPSLSVILPIFWCCYRQVMIDMVLTGQTGVELYVVGFFM